MKKILLALLVCFPVISGFAPEASASSLQSSRTQITRFQGASIKGIEVRSAIEVEVISTSSTKVIADLPRDLEPYFVMEMRNDGTLVLERKNTSGRRTYGSIKVTVYTSVLNTLKVSGASSVKCTGKFTGDRLNLDVSGSSTVSNLGHKTSGDVKINCSGASKITNADIIGSNVNITVSGSSVFEPILRANRGLQISVSGASKTKGQYVSFGDTKVSVSGSSYAEMDASAEGVVTLTVSGASSFKEGFRCAGFRGEVSGSSSYQGTLACSGAAEFKVSSASTANVSGKARDLKLEVKGSSNFKSGSFSANTCNARISGASSGNLMVVSELSANVSGSSSFKYTGSPRVREQVVASGSSLVKQ